MTPWRLVYHVMWLCFIAFIGIAVLAHVTYQVLVKMEIIEWGHKEALLNAIQEENLVKKGSKQLLHSFFFASK